MCIRDRDEGEPLIVYDMNSRFCEDTVVQEWGTYELYAGFKGYIAMPLESYGVYSQADINAVGIRYAPGASFNQGEGNIVFDNFFLYGYDCLLYTSVQYEGDVQEKNIKQFEMVYFSKLHI